jgi:hypothetical protein
MTRDLHRSFLRRLNIKEDSLFFTIETNLKVEGCNSAADVSRRILNQIIDDLENKGIVLEGKRSYEALKKYFESSHFKTILVAIYIQESSINHSQKFQKYKEGMAVFARDVRQLSGIAGKSLMVCVCLEEYRKRNFLDYIIWFSRPPLSKVVSHTRDIERLPRLSGITEGDLRFWLNKYVVDTSGNKIDGIVKNIYKKGIKDLPLVDIEKELELIIQAYNLNTHGTD